jgi:polysaccharide biosynthesis/export protein
MGIARLFVCLTGAVLAACSTLPTAGPTKGQVEDQAAPNGRLRFDLIDVNEKVVSAVLARPAQSFRTAFRDYGKPPNPKIGIGDTVAVTIWEAAGGGLFGAAPTENTAAGPQRAEIPNQVVAPDGAISVPFAGRVPVAGRTPLEVQQEIEQRLSEKAIQPQVVVTVPRSVTNSAVVSGEVINGARVPLSVGGDQLLDLIATAGGAKAPLYKTFVRLSRGGVTATIPMEQLVSDPGENIYAWPGDALTLVSLPQTFSVFGATGQNTQIDFNAYKMTVADALAKAGGLQDQRADPAGVFLFRFEPPALIHALRAPALPIGPSGSSPVVYRFDMSDANSYFLVDRFPIEDKDLIYIANARLTELQKFFTLLNTLTGPIISGVVVHSAVHP